MGKTEVTPSRKEQTIPGTWVRNPKTKSQANCFSEGMLCWVPGCKEKEEASLDSRLAGLHCGKVPVVPAYETIFVSLSQTHCS